MTHKNICIVIFVIAGIGCLLAVWFGFSYDESQRDLFREVAILKKANPALLEEFQQTTLQNLPDFVAKNEQAIAEQREMLKHEQTQTYSSQKEYVAALNRFNTRSKNITSLTSEAGRKNDFAQLQSEVKQCNRESNSLNIIAVFFYIMLFGTIAVVVFFACLQFVRHPKSFRKMLWSVLSLGILFLLGYVISSETLTPIALKAGLTENGVRLIGAGVITFYFLLIGAIASIVVSWLINKYKTR